MASALNGSQVKRLGERLFRTTGHVYDTAEAMFGIRPGEEVFSQLLNAGYAKCVECNHWLTLSDFPTHDDSDFPIACQSCLDGDDC